MTQLERDVSMAKSTLRRHIDRLEDAGYVERRSQKDVPNASTTDGRAVLVFRTTKGDFEIKKWKGDLWERVCVADVRTHRTLARERGGYVSKRERLAKNEEQALTGELEEVLLTRQNEQTNYRSPSKPNTDKKNYYSPLDSRSSSNRLLEELHTPSDRGEGVSGIRSPDFARDPELRRIFEGGRQADGSLRGGSNRRQGQAEAVRNCRCGHSLDDTSRAVSINEAIETRFPKSNMTQDPPQHWKVRK